MVGDTFNPTGLKLNVLYNTGKTQNIDTIVDGKTVYYLFDGSNYYDSEGNAVEEAVAKAATYYIDLSPVSYTHLDVYKRQVLWTAHQNQN